MKRFPYIIIMLLWFLPAISKPIFTERIFISTTETDYRPGDSICIWGRILATDSIRKPFSKYLYVEIFNRQDSVLLRKKLICNESGCFTAKLPTSPLWEADIYYLRAYSKLMQNFSPQSYPIQPLQIGKRIAQPEQFASNVICKFFPEGGTLVDGVPQKIALYLTDNNGLPLSTQFHIITGNDTINTLHTSPSGLQQISFVPQKEKKYELHTTVDGKNYHFRLPTSGSSNTLQVIGNSRRLTYRILGNNNQTIQKLYIFQENMGLQELGIGKNKSGIINLGDISSGLITFFLTDTLGNVIAERNYFVPEKKHEIPQLIKSEFSAEEDLQQSIVIPDSSQFFLRCYPSGYWCGLHAENELSWIADLESSAPFPIHYYKCNQEIRQKELECWLMASRFIRFELQTMLSKEFQYRFANETAMVLDGKITHESRKAIRGGFLQLFNTKNGDAYLVNLDSDGTFQLAVSDFEEGCDFFVSAGADKKKSKETFQYYFNDEIYPPVINPHPINKEVALGNIEVEIQANQHSLYGVDKNNILPEIIVKAKVGTKPYIPTERFYKTNFIDVEAEEDKYTNFADIIHDIPTIAVEETYQVQNGRRIKSYIFLPTRGGSTFGTNNGITVLIDGMRIDANEAMSFLPSELSSVEYLPPREAIKVTFGAIYGALIIKTRTGKKKKEEEKPPAGIIYTPTGLSNLKSPHQPTSFKAPKQEGVYNVLIDIILKDGKAISSEQTIIVRKAP